MRLVVCALVLAGLPAAAQTLVRLWDRQITAVDVQRAHSDAVKYVAMTIEDIFTERYLRDNKLEPSAEVLDLVRQKLRPPNAGVSTPMTEMFAQRIVRSYYLSSSLWRKHSGRVVLSAFGSCLAKDALVAELRALEAAGLLTFPGGPRLRADVYRYLEALPGDGVISGERAREFLSRPVWERESAMR